MEIYQEQESWKTKILKILQQIIAMGVLILDKLVLCVNIGLQYLFVSIIEF